MTTQHNQSVQLNMLFPEAPEVFVRYHKDNPQVYQKFREITLQTIQKGFKRFGAKGIFEIMRWQTGVEGGDKYKVNNNYTSYYSRLFEREFPQYKGFFRMRKSKYDEDKYEQKSKEVSLKIDSRFLGDKKIKSSN